MSDDLREDEYEILRHPPGEVDEDGSADDPSERGDGSGSGPLGWFLGQDARLRGWLRSASTPVERATCPIDNWEFAPQYTDGACPLCGWRPPGRPVTAPLAARLDWFWPSVVFLAVVSVVMAILVIAAYVKT